MSEKNDHTSVLATSGEKLAFFVPDWPPDWPEIRDSVQDCLKSGDWGRYQSEFSRRLAAKIGQLLMASSADSEPSVRLCSSGTAATEIALRAAGVGPGDEVAVSAMDYPGNFRCIELVGARPVLIDLHESSPTMSLESLGRAIEQHRGKWKAIIVSHLFGHACAITEIHRLAKQAGCRLIEDACQTIGMRIDDEPVGGFGDLATLSFGGSKVVSAGNGGAIIANDPKLTARIDRWMDRPSEAFPLSPLQAAVILPQLERLESINQIRRECVDYLVDSASKRFPSWQILPSDSSSQAPTYYKLAWLAQSSEHCRQIIAEAKTREMPIGACFRSMDRSSEKRCCKPVPLDHARDFASRAFLLDHRALLVSPGQRERLVEWLAKLHEATSQRLDVSSS